MGRMDINGSPTVTMEINGFKGINNATQFSQIDIRQSPKMLNLLPGKVGGLRNRDGTRPLTFFPTPGLKRMGRLRKNQSTTIVAAANTTLYEYLSNSWTPAFMNVFLDSPDIDTVQFRDSSANEVLIITDGGGLKYYDGISVSLVPPAPNDPSPNPVNDLPNINTNNPPVGITTHNNRLVIWPNNKDIIFHSRPGYYDYFPANAFQRFVNDNDTIQTCISFGSSLLVFMRRCIGVLFGDGYLGTDQDWYQDFLDTTDGCVNGRSVQIVVFPNGEERVFYQTDKGVSAVYNVDTKSLDNSTRLATVSMTDTKIDWNALGITKAEWMGAVSYFYQGRYWLIYKQGTTYQGLVYDTTSNEWFPVNNIDANDFYGGTIDSDTSDDYLWFITEAGHLKRFQDFPAIGVANYDYQDINLLTGTPVQWEWYSKLMNPQITGFDHFWDILMIEAQQFEYDSVINVEVNTFNDRFTQLRAVKTEIMIVNVSVIGQAQIGNDNLTDIINNAKRIRAFVKGQYAQVRLWNDDGMPAEVFDIRFEVRPQTAYG
ncbi:hypothetical protein [Cohnella zeiphila]|uniref:Uncharacterized protein n=1 Tax=Cohnella zeiphila TaxID=2761120 RepID=A0A7X0VVE0_9BACL|nr:hypothetical protein [Cohnella zeiphila]MBB6731886.1 hypothetical protein [Cohnella zeiphila]